ncbi:MFS transporter [Rhizorhabdus argentea]|uniref:MFS transporter n=1 Tax=Rhizorhabdus argentea TaxID=1387174 RepID=UPI0030EBF22E
MATEAEPASTLTAVEERPTRLVLASTDESPRWSMAWYALGILCVVTLLSQLDRHITTIIVTPLKTEFAISDTQFALLHGYGFAITYAIFGIPFGRLVDRKDRRNIIMYGLFAWSLLTSLSAFAGSYIELLLLRTGVGIGEAVLGPAAYSLLIDFFEPKQRGRATSIYYVAMSLGSGASLLLGGALLSLIPPAGLDMAGLIKLEPWRLLFLFAGLPGLFGCLLMLTIKEPKRRNAVPGDNVSLGAFLSYVWAHKALLIRISVASTLMATAGYGTAAWAPTLLERRFGLPPASTALGIGTAMIVGSVAGTLLSGAISDRMIARRLLSARTRPMLFGYLALLPASLFGLMPDPRLAILCFGVILFSVAMAQSAAPLALQEAVPANMRGQIVALQFLILALCSIGLGPAIVGVLTDSVFQSSEMLGWSILALILPISLIGIVVCGFGLTERAYQLTEAKD